ncbi:MAG: aldose epimerase family protein, partial [Pyrinomonadaceae bacterium]
VPDRAGHFDDVLLGFDTLEGYLKESSFYVGPVIGRYANRIAKGRFALNGKEYKLAVNNGENHLHGGLKGFDKVVWKARPLQTRGGAALELTYLSNDGEEGYPGNLSVKVVYLLTDRDELKIDYSATTDQDTIVNLTNHAYFNLAGQGNGNILKHRLSINADCFIPADDKSIPTGELRSVAGTPFDFRRATAIGARIEVDDEQLKFGRGYDHTFVIDGRAGTLRRAATASDPMTGRVMEVWTTEPGMQLYTGNYLESTMVGKGGKAYGPRYGFCLETQHFPDSPNKPNFPSTVLRKGGRYNSTTVYKFSAR